VESFCYSNHFSNQKFKAMSKSKIAIVIASSIYTWDRFTNIAAVINAVTDADGMALIIPSQSKVEGIAALLNLADGVVLVCPENCQGGNFELAAEDNYAREFGRQAVEAGINSLKIIGDRNFIASDKEWQDWAEFLRVGAQSIPLDETEEIQEAMREFVPVAATRSAFRRLAREQRRVMAHELRSPVTHS
jgi:hypothetical protein